MNIVVPGKNAQLVKSAEPVALVRCVWETLRQEKQPHAIRSSARSLMRTMRAGTPATTALSGTGLVTTEPAATTELLPISDMTIAPLPIQLPRPTLTIDRVPACSLIGMSVRSMPCVLDPLGRWTPDATSTSSSRCTMPTLQAGPIYTFLSILASTLENTVPQQTTTPGPHSAIA